MAPTRLRDHLVQENPVAIRDANARDRQVFVQAIQLRQVPEDQQRADEEPGRTEYSQEAAAF